MRGRDRLVCAVCVAVVAPIAPVAADGLFHRISDELAHRGGAQRVPPTPAVVKWRPQKLVPALDLGAPLVALAAGDLDGDGAAELYAVTTREVIAVAVAGARLRELGRVAFVGDKALHYPRDPVGAAVIDGTHLIASASGFAHTLIVQWRGTHLSADPGPVGMARCAGEIAELVPGRNYFGDGSYAMRCRDDLMGADAAPLHVRAQLSVAGKLAVSVARCAAGGCLPAGDYAYTHVGVGFELLDVDRDGQPELAFAGAGAPGEPDELRVVTLGQDEHKPRLKKAFPAGGIAAITSGDLERTGPVIVAAVRPVGATQVDLWRMN